MLAQTAADLVVLLHFTFILFVIVGGALVLKWPWLIYLHLPAATWGVIVEFTGWLCPLTPLENKLRMAGGEAGYSGSFVENYIVPIIYPDGLTHRIQILIGVGILTINLVFYGMLVKRKANT